MRRRAHGRGTVPELAALSARRYWALFLLYLALGALAGFALGALGQTASDLPGWGYVGAAAGFVAGLAAFLLRADT